MTGRALLVWMAVAGCRRDPTVGGRDSALADAPGRVVLMVVDGVRIDEMLSEVSSPVSGRTGEELMPLFHGDLAPAGTLFARAVNGGVTVTTEAHASMLTGRRLPLGTFPPSSGDSYATDLPTLFEVVRRSRGLDQGQVALVANAVMLSDLQTSHAPGYGSDYAPTYEFRTNDEGRDLSDPEIVEQVGQRLADYDTWLAVANLHQVDYAGHTGALGDYPARIEDVDAPLASLLAWIEATPPYAGNTTLIVVSDHGRHRTGESEDWRQHGDACSGCRDVPLLVLGQGADAGRVVETPATLTDVAATMAARLGVDLPMAEGIDLLGDGRPVGEVGVAADRLVATQRWTEDATTRSEIRVDGEVVSSTGALFAERPSVVGDLVCWRELILTDDLGDEEPWVPRCLRGGEDVGAPVRTVSAQFAPALALDDDDRAWLAWSHNPNGYTGSDGVTVRVARHDGAWSEPRAEGPELFHPGPPALWLDGDRAVVAVAASDAVEGGRDSRRISVLALDWGDTPSWATLARLDFGDGLERMEHPALHGGEAGLSLAFVGYRPTPAVVLSASADGRVWTAPRLLDSDRVLPHVVPAWTADGRLLWAALNDAGTVAVRLWDGDEVTEWDSGADAIDGLAADAGLVSLRVDGGWQTVALGN